MTRKELMDNLVATLREEFKGYELMGSSKELQPLQVYPQYLPQPAGVTVGNAGLQNYKDDDYNSKFPCIIVRLEDMTDKEETGFPGSLANVKLIQGIYDPSEKCTGWQYLLDIQDRIRRVLFEHRVLGRKHVLRMPVTSRLLDVETWPVYFGEMSLVYTTGRPMMNAEYVYRPQPPQPPRERI